MHHDQNMLTIPSGKKGWKPGVWKASKEGSGTWISTGRWQQQPSVFAVFLTSLECNMVEVEEMGR